MADEKYSIDEILKEIDSARGAGKQKKSTLNSSANSFDDTDEIDKLINSNKNSKPDLSVTEVINSIGSGKQREPAKSAKQRTEEEVNARIAAEVSSAADKRRKAVLDEDKDLDVDFGAKQRSDAEVEARIAKDISNAADIKKWESLSNSDDTKTVENDNDEIEFHDASSFVPTETMEMRRMQKIKDINNAMLKIDSEAETPDEMLDSLNPMDSRQKVSEKIKKTEDTDTLAVSGNDLKSIGKSGEYIKEYTPSVSRKREQSEEETEVQPAPFTGELHVGDSIIDALNKKISEQENEPDISESVSEPEETEENEELEKIKAANELAQKKKRKISEFILDNRDDTEETDKVSQSRSENTEEYDDEDEEEEEESIDINDEEVIRDRLHRASKGLWGRLVILIILFAAAVFVGAINIFKINIGRIGNMFSYRSSPENYLYAHLAIGILSFTACSSVVSNGFSRLFKGRPDGDTLCALAHMGSLAATIPYLMSGAYIQLGYSQIYLAISLGAMIFNTISKLLTVKTAQNNFDFVFGKNSKYFIEHCEGKGAEQLAKGAVSGMPSVVSIRKTEMLCDFIVSTYCEDSSDRTSRKIAPIAIIAAIVGGVAAYFTSNANITINRFSWVATVASAILAVCAPFSSSMTATLPLYLASRKASKRGSAILGFGAVEDLTDANSVLADAKTLFPAETIKIVNICGYDTPKTRGEGKINIDEAIIYAASLAVASDSVLADSLFHILNYKKEMLKPVSGCVYENNMGVMGWINRRRVLLGTRAHMKAHEITVPNIKKETAANKNNDQVIYLAIGGEVCLLFFVRATADPAIRRSVRELAFRDIKIIVKTVDGMITAPALANVFGVDEEDFKVLPYEMHDTFDENTKFVSSGSAAISSDGTFSSVSGSIVAARRVRDRAVIGNIMQVVGVVLGIAIAIIFTVVTNEEQLKTFNLLNVFYVLLYNSAWGLLTLLLEFLRR